MARYVPFSLHFNSEGGSVCFIEMIVGISIMLAFTGVTLGTPVWLAIKVGESTGQEWIVQIALYAGLIGIVFLLSYVLLKQENQIRNIIENIRLSSPGYCLPSRVSDEGDGESVWIRR